MAAARAGTVPGGLHGKPGAVRVIPGSKSELKALCRQSPEFNWTFLRKVVTACAIKCPPPVAPKPTVPTPGFFSAVRKLQRGAKSDGDDEGGPKWTRVREMLLTRTASATALLTTEEEEEEAVWRRLRQAVLLKDCPTGLDDVVKSFLGLSRHQGRLQSRDGAVSVQSAHASRPRMQRKRSTPSKPEAQGAVAQPRARMWRGRALSMPRSGFGKASLV
ncbi:hypothetical protein T484DRAFT_1849918 [Baffinella frigidus]|nr:hypothetical protein T484DRAFT_1849918 [Cryptophyta sp. CCMP2293]